MNLPYIVAEIASAHEGDPALARRLFELAAGTGADAVKFQIFRRDALISRFHPKFESFGQIEIAAETWREILAEYRGASVAIWVEAFDEPSLDLAEGSGSVSGYKLPTSDIANLRFLAAAAHTGKPLHLAVGGATDAEIAAALGVISPLTQARVTLMHGFQSYPTRIEDMKLARLPALKQRFGLPVGFADHTDASAREQARTLPAMALAAGAEVIEKHVTDDRSRKGRDHFSALEPAEFADFTRFLRLVGTSLGDGGDALSPAETKYRYEMKRQAVAAGSLPRDHHLTAKDAVFKRTNRAGLSESDVERLAGRLLAAAKLPDEPILAEDLP